MSHTYRINPETHEEEVERRYLKRKKKRIKSKDFDAEKHQVLLGYDHLGDAIFGTDSNWLKELDDESSN